jgi:hypothetical protein
MKLNIPNTRIRGIPVQDCVAGGTTLLTLALLEKKLQGVFVDVDADHYTISETVHLATPLSVAIGRVTEPFTLEFDNILFAVTDEQSLYELNLYLEHR